jgi:hypothetical protein
MNVQTWSSTDLVHDISNEDVDKACDLEANGCQQLRWISETVKTHFRFTVSLGGHKAETIFTIFPVDAQDSLCSCTKVKGSYWPCCDREDVEGHIKSSIQVVYNVYIRANRQTFDHTE